jgi:hypothetical protein
VKQVLLVTRNIHGARIETTRTFNEDIRQSDTLPRSQ